MPALASCIADTWAGNINLDREAAYSNPSPLAIINEDYKEGQLNPYPGPRNFGPDSPVAWLPEEVGSASVDES